MWIEPSCRKIVVKYLRFEKNESFMRMGPKRSKIATIWKMWIEPRCRKILGKYLRFEKSEMFLGELDQIVGKFL